MLLGEIGTLTQRVYLSITNLAVIVRKGVVWAYVS